MDLEPVPERWVEAHYISPNAVRNNLTPTQGFSIVSFLKFRRHSITLTLGLLTVAAFALPPSTAGAAQSNKPLPAKKIVTKSDKDINAIRTYFFCQTAKCKKAASANETTALSALADLKTEMKIMKSDAVPTSEAAIVAKYQVDTKALVAAFTNYPKETASDAVANNIGIIYYQTSNIGSDDYLLGCASTKTPVSFKTWSVGVVGVAYAMQVATQAETATAPASTIASANESLLAEAASMKSDANGPNAAFNKLLVQFAATQALDSRDSLLVLENKAGTITPAVLKALSTKLSAEFKKIAAEQNKLAT